MRFASLAMLAAIVLVGGCSTPAATGELPGPVSDGVVFRQPPDNAPDAPAVELDLIDGRDFDLAEQWADRPVVLVFFESWCTVCREQQPGINELVADYRDVILFVGIASMSEPADVEQYVSDNDITYPVGIDPSGRSWLQYAVAEPPLVALISKDGRVLRGWPGGVESDVLRQQIEDLAVESH
jgi:thiol-disulfide isomerase/thioredoxin